MYIHEGLPTVRPMMTSHMCTWYRGVGFSYCNECGAYKEDGEPELVETGCEEVKCKHEWECLRDRCHNRGGGKYKAYKCRLCGKFQRR